MLLVRSEVLRLSRYSVLGKAIYFEAFQFSWRLPIDVAFQRTHVYEPALFAGNTRLQAPTFDTICIFESVTDLSLTFVFLLYPPVNYLPRIIQKTFSDNQILVKICKPFVTAQYRWQMPNVFVFSLVVNLVTCWKQVRSWRYYFRLRTKYSRFILFRGFDNSKNSIKTSFYQNRARYINEENDVVHG